MNEAKVLAAYNYLEANGFDGFYIPEAKTFDEYAVEAFTVGGDVDFTNGVILDTTFVNNDKAYCTYQQISQNATIKNLLENFTGVENQNNLIFQVIPDLVCNNASDPSGCTESNLNSNNSITISLDRDYVNSNQTLTLFIARTIIHEAIHANMYLALYNQENGNTTNLPGINDFPEIYEQYRQMINAQHEFMAEHYTSLIAQTLQEIHPLLNDQIFIDSLADFDMSLSDFYTSIAYLGLNDTIGQTNYLNNPTNAENYSLSFEHAKANSTKTPNCN